ncbi:MAG: hypothetical protein OEM26_10105, partial [Saprospiraceae bacterium]|nr:hypothetical protein [Saprospiraceae bacterium]
MWATKTYVQTLLSLTLVLISIPALTLYAQTDAQFKPRFEVFELPGGTLGNNVNCIIQDSFGFVWLGSHGGLHRFDGHRIKTFKHDPRDTTSISESYIEWLHMDPKGRLWIGTYGGGVNCYDHETGTFRRYMHDPEDENSLSHNYIQMITHD